MKEEWRMENEENTPQSVVSNPTPLRFEGCSGTVRLSLKL